MIEEIKLESIYWYNMWKTQYIEQTTCRGIELIKNPVALFFLVSSEEDIINTSISIM